MFLNPSVSEFVYDYKAKYYDLGLIEEELLVILNKYQIKDYIFKKHYILNTVGLIDGEMVYYFNDVIRTIEEILEL